jgi:hypothetical protein
MSVGEPDPIQLQPPACFDGRFARLTLSVENAPREGDGAAVLRGSVLFGERSHVAPSGVVYRLGVKFAGLFIEEAHCDYRANRDLQERTQDGQFRQKESQSAKRSWGASGKVSGGLKGLSGGMSATGAAEMEAGAQTREESERRFACHRQRIVSGGWELGDRALGDPLERDGLIKGVFLSGVWGELAPLRGEMKFGARIRLTLPRGGLVVLDHGESGFASVADRLAMKSPEEARRARAFSALKCAVAGWGAEDMIAGDEARGEITLAHAAVAVDLTALAGACAPKAPALAARTRVALPTSTAAPDKTLEKPACKSRAGRGAAKETHS